MAEVDDLQEWYANRICQVVHAVDKADAGPAVLKDGVGALLGEVIEKAREMLWRPADYLKSVESILLAHQRMDYRGCLCGWSELGRSHPGHQVAMLRRAGLLNDPQTEAVEWHPYDYDDREGTAPPDGQLVWIREWQYVEGTTVGYFDGSMCLWTGSDDVLVSHWALIPMPDGPTPEDTE